jgi:dihydrofolate reductase
VIKNYKHNAASVDGYIASPDGGVDWLDTAGKVKADMSTDDMGFQSFMHSVDCMIMGRKCMETISGMNLIPEQRVYGDRHIVVLSNKLNELSENLRRKVEMYSGDIQDLINELQGKVYKHACIDGGATITSFFNAPIGLLVGKASRLWAAADPGPMINRHPDRF